MIIIIIMVIIKHSDVGVQRLIAAAEWLSLIFFVYFLAFLGIRAVKDTVHCVSKSELLWNSEKIYTLFSLYTCVCASVSPCACVGVSITPPVVFMQFMWYSAFTFFFFFHSKGNFRPLQPTFVQNQSLKSKFRTTPQKMFVCHISSLLFFVNHTSLTRFTTSTLSVHLTLFSSETSKSWRFLKDVFFEILFPKVKMLACEYSFYDIFHRTMRIHVVNKTFIHVQFANFLMGRRHLKKK